MLSEIILSRFNAWFAEARAHPAIFDATAMCLATAGADGRPAARMVLLKGADARGFVFYTNMESRKGEELRENPQAALCFYWPAIKKQIRIEGAVEQVGDAEADEYFFTRPHESQIAAWASQQSRALDSREDLERAVAAHDARFRPGAVPRPSFWSGWRVLPDMVEFWHEAPHRLHDRECFRRSGDEWEMVRLYP